MMTRHYQVLGYLQAQRWQSEGLYVCKTGIWMVFIAKTCLFSAFILCDLSTPMAAPDNTVHGANMGPT